MALMIGGDYVKALYFKGEEYTTAILNNEVIFQKKGNTITLKQGVLDKSKGDEWILYFKNGGTVSVKNKGDLLLVDEYRTNLKVNKRDVPIAYNMVISPGSLLKIYPKEGISNATVSITVKI